MPDKIMYVITDELVVLHAIEMGKDDVTAVPEAFSLIDEDTLQDLIDAGEDVTMSEDE